ncbi:MAG: leucine-rich repeat protein [Clostridia bacterium]|nr:leucine-rich repeat protein [Clostridia bacterium]
MKKISKKMLAALLALIMVISAAPLTGVLATESFEPEQIVIDSSAETDFSELGENLDILKNISDSENLQNIDMSGIKEALNLDSETSEEAKAEEKTSEAPEEMFGPELPAESGNFLAEEIEKPLETMAVVEMLSTNSTVDYTINANETLNINVQSSSITYIKFVPETDGFYTFQSISNSDTIGYIYDENFDQIAYNDDYSDSNFYISYFLTAGKTYYLGARYYSYYSGNFDVSLTKAETTKLNLDETTTVAFESGLSPYLEIVPQKSGEYIIILNDVTYDDNIDFNDFGFYPIVDSYYKDNNFIIRVFLTEDKPYYLNLYTYGDLKSVDINLTFNETLVLELDETLTIDIDNNNSSFVEFTTEADGFYNFSTSNGYCEFNLYNSELELIEDYYSSNCRALLTGNRKYYLRLYIDDTVNLSVSIDKNTKMYNISENSTINIDVSSNSNTLVKFVPTVTGNYEFKSLSKTDPFCTLYIEHSFWGINTDYDSGNNDNFRFQYYFEAGKSYYFYVRLESDGFANFDVKLTEICNHTVTNGSAFCDKCGECIFIYDTLSIYDDKTEKYYDCVTISECVTTISGMVYFPETIDGYIVEGIAPDIFAGFNETNGITGIYIPRNVKYFEGCINPYNLSEIKVDSANEYFTVVNGVVYSKDMKTLVCYPAAKEGTSFTVPESVEKIGNHAFSNCGNLTEIVIPSTVKEIGYMAFYSCASLESITIPEGVETIESYAFYNCGNLTEIVIPSTVKRIHYGAFYYCRSLSDITLVSDRTEFDKNAFESTAHYNNPSNWEETESGASLYYVDGYLVACNSIWIVEEIKIREGTRAICSEIFLNSNLTKAYLPNSVRYIGDRAFKSSNITEINLPDGVELGERVFAYCYNLETITAGQTIKGLDTDDLTSTEFYTNKDNYENGVLYLADSLLKVLPDYESETFIVSDKFKQIGASAFENCTSIKNISIPSSVEYIGDGAFTFCASLESIILPEGLEVIEPNTFAGCLALKSIEIPSTVKEIGEFAFALNISLESIDLPNAITQINQGTFLGCVSFKELPLNDNIVSIDEFAFCGCASISEIYIGKNLEEIGFTAFTGCSSLQSFYVDPANEAYLTDNYGALYTRIPSEEFTGTALISYPAASPATEYVVPDDCYAFYVPFVSCVNLETIEVHDKLFIDPTNGEFGDEMAYTLFAISSATMKVDINSTIAYIKDNGENIESLARDIFGIIYGFDEGDDENSVNAINGAVDIAEEYITRFNSFDELCNELLGLLTEVFEVVSFDTFKGFDFDNHPNISDDDGVLYISTTPDDSGNYEKVLISCPAAKTGTVKIAVDTTNILLGAFVFCDLDKVIIPDSVDTIEPITFALSRIDELTIPQSIIEINELAFALSEIKTLRLKNLNYFEYGNTNDLAFLGLFADKIILPSSLEYIPDNVFAGCLAKEYDLPSSIQFIDEYAFLANIFLEEISIPYKTINIGEAAFIGCINLQKVSFNKLACNLMCIDDGAFAFTGIKEFDLPDSVQEIGIMAFGPSVSGLANYAADYFRVLLDEVNASLEEKDYAINTAKIVELVKYVGNWFEPFEGVTTTASNKFFKAVDGDLFNAHQTTLIKVADSKSGNYIIPSGVMNIESGAFAFTSVTNVYIPDSVTTLENGAFVYSPITDITIGGGITKIPNGAFSNCYNLKRVTILPTVTSIGENAFKGCSEDLVIVGYAYSYAHEYAIENEIKFETIDGRGYISLKAPSEVASEKVPVYGNTIADTTVEIYVNGIKVSETGSENNGYWRTAVDIPNPVNNTTYEITAKIYNGTEKEVVSTPIYVNYNTNVPAFLSITAYHSNQSRTISLYDFGKTPEYMSFNSYSPFTYEIKLSSYDGTKTLYVVSGDYKIPAVYDAKTDTYIATGYFESSRSYIPEYITLELDGCTLANTAFRFPFIIDPSGFVYEAVHSNRVEGANVSIYYQDENGLAQLWEDAFIYGQESSIITGSEGLFSWDVPKGYWQVKAEKENYETGYSDWLPVPPEQLEVYIGLISKLSPNVKYINAYSDGIDITFDQYMDISTINSSNITVTDESGKTIEGSWAAVDSEVSGTASNVSYATTFSFSAYSTLEGNITVSVRNVENYADKAISVPYIKTVNVKPKVEALNAPKTLTLVYGKDYSEDDTNKVVIDGGEGAAGLTVNVVLKDNFYISSVTTVTLDDEGKATIEIEPTKPGITVVSFNLDGTNLVEETEVVVKMPEETRVTGVTLSETTAELQVDAEKYLFANVAPDFATDTSVVWSSTDNSIATVDENGLVKGINPGSANIVVTTVDGGFTAECDITIVSLSYVITWIINGEEQYTTLNAGDAITAPQVPEIEGYEFKGWSAEIPTVMPKENLTFTAVFEKIPDAPVVPTDPAKKDIIIDPSETTIKYGDAIILNVPSAEIPKGGYVEWKVDNESYFKCSKHSETSLRLDPEKSGTVTVIATIYDVNGNAVSTDSQTMTSKAGFFDKIIAFFKRIFGLTKVINQSFSALYY